MQINLTFLFLILSFRCPLELIWLIKSLQNQNDLTSSEALIVSFLHAFLLVFVIDVAQNPFPCGDFGVN
jgi:hypothetical protein